MRGDTPLRRRLDQGNLTQPFYQNTVIYKISILFPQFLANCLLFPQNDNISHTPTLLSSPCLYLSSSTYVPQETSRPSPTSLPYSTSLPVPLLYHYSSPILPAPILPALGAGSSATYPLLSLPITLAPAPALALPIPTYTPTRPLSYPTTVPGQPYPTSSGRRL